MSNAESPLFVNAIAKCFKVLDVFDGPKRQMTMVEIAQESGLDRSAAQRMVFTLETLGYLARVPGTKTYALTSRLLSFSYNYVRSHQLISKAMPYLQELSTTFNETVNLQELDHTEIVLIARVVSPHLLNVRVAVGSRLPTFCTASGTAILASLPTAHRDRVLADSKLVPLTPHTEIQRKKLIARIEHAALKGYSIVADQAVIGDISLAAPVIGSDGLPRAAVNISVPSNRWTVDSVERKMAKHVQAAARALSVDTQ
ncbi:IclR family transcriptional regulator [Ottowia thiooxydans]|uniref:IclR family transcriptional regulator n=1 Tax=Ottowia thiooxydans TaxID=219182 RepID=UPI000406F50A|nr:IclR family transcriptional regulator C-terminal domain-containing protein [Ottowia thiooxydans]